MDRRKFIKSLGVTALLPAIPTPAFSLATVNPATAAPLFSDHTYEWAKMIVRAHDKCNIGLLQRSLHIDPSAAEALKSALIRNGVVQSQANAYGIHKATEPLYREAFMNVSEPAKKVVDKAMEFLERAPQEEEPTKGEPEHEMRDDPTKTSSEDEGYDEHEEKSSEPNA